MSDHEPGTPTVLIVDDEEDIADIYTLQLQDRYDVRTEYGGQEAIEAVDEDVDVVLLDRRMPGLSGDQVLERIRDQDLDCRVAMVTAVEPDFDILEMGFDAYLTKPVKSEQLAETVENLIERSEYDSLLQEYYGLVEKQATLEATKSRGELEESEEYEALKRDIDALRDDLSATLGGIEDDEDFIATIRGLGDGGDD